MPATHRTRLLIIGAGPAGYTAAIYAARAGLKPIVVAGLQPGGQLTITTDVENYPGFAETVQGPWLMEQFRAQASHVGAAVAEDVVASVDFSERPFRAMGDSGEVYLGDAVVIATGAQARWLGIPGERELSGFGVSACATCDGFFFRGRNVAVVGGGNTAVEEALYLSNLAARVTVIHRRDRFRAERILQERLAAKTNIQVVWNTVADAVLGTEGKLRSVRGLALRNVATGERAEAPFDGVFVAIGHDPATALFRGQVGMDEDGYIRTEPGTTRTDVEGVFAAGDVQDRIYRQAVTAAGTGCMAALEAEKWLAHLPADAPAVEAWTEAGRGVPLDWDKLRVFHAVAEAGSFTHAGETLNLSQSAVSRQIQALEELLHVPLFHRHARGLILTEPGETLNRAVREVFAKLAMTEALLTESRERPAGRLKVTSTAGFGNVWLAPRLHRFLGLYPEVSVVLLLDDFDLDLAMREADVAIRMHPPRQPDLIQRHIASFGWRVCAAPSYLKKAGIPQRAEDLDAHRIICWGDHRPPTDQINWLTEAGRRPGAPRRAVVEINSQTGILRAVRSGLGLAALPEYMAHELGGLLCVLPEMKTPRLDAYFVYPEELRHSKRVTVFRDFIMAELAAVSGA